jgi:Fe-S-cluster containining protein
MILDFGYLRHVRNYRNSFMKAFKCKKCGTCCYGKGGIYVQQDEIERIADFLGIDSASFISRFCDEEYGRISIKSGEDGYCIFFDKERQCTIHPVNPTPCSSWPFYDALLKDPDNWNSAKDACPGINPDCSFEDFVRQAKEEASEHQGP